MGAVYGEIMGWVKENGYFVCGPPLEFYLSQPEIDDAGGMSGTVEISFPVIEAKKQ